MTRLAQGAVVVATLLVAAGYGLESRFTPALALLLLGGGWLYAQQRSQQCTQQHGWLRVTNLCFALMLLASAVALAFAFTSPLALAGGVMTLVAWDLERFARHLAQAERVEHESALKRAHMQRLVGVVLVGTALAVLGLTVRVELNFVLAFVLGLLAVVGIGRALSLLR